MLKKHLFSKYNSAYFTFLFAQLERVQLVLDIQLFACWVILHSSLTYAVLFSKKIAVSKNYINTFRVSYSLDPDQAPCFVRPDLGPNCFQRLSTDFTNRPCMITVQKIIGQI